MSLDDDVTFVVVLTVGTLLATLAAGALTVLVARWVERRKVRVGR